MAQAYCGQRRRQHLSDRGLGEEGPTGRRASLRSSGHAGPREALQLSGRSDVRGAGEVYEVLGSGAPVLLLPAFSTVSSREEMRPLGSGLAASGFACTLVDWPGFGSSTRGRLEYSPECYLHFLADFAAATTPSGAVIAAGHATGYALRLGREHPGVWRRIAFWRRPGEVRFRLPWGRTRQSTRPCGRSSAPRSSAGDLPAEHSSPGDCDDV